MSGAPSSSGGAYPNFTITRKKLKDGFLEQAGAEFGPWIEDLIGESLPSPGQSDLLEALKGGEVLCKLVNKILLLTGTGEPVKWKAPTTPFFAVENIKLFLRGCGKIGLKSSVCIIFFHLNNIDFFSFFFLFFIFIFLFFLNVGGL